MLTVLLLVSGPAAACVLLYETRRLWQWSHGRSTGREASTPGEWEHAAFLSASYV
jgi:hypothetical protein